MKTRLTILNSGRHAIQATRLNFSVLSFLVFFILQFNVAQAQVPSDLMENCDQWKITYPDGEEDKTLCGEANNEYFYVSGNAIVFYVPIRSDNGSTPSSDYIRSELREREEDGSKDIYWTTEGTHMLYVKQAITHLPMNKSHLVATQIHGNKEAGIDDAMVMRLENAHLFLSFNGGKLRDDLTIKTNYSLGTVHEVIFLVKDDKHYCYYSEDGNLWNAYNSGNASSYLVTDNGDPVLMDRNYGESYFKVGNYTQSNPDEEGDDTDNPNNYGEVKVYDFSVSHGEEPPTGGGTAPYDLAKFQDFLAECKLQSPGSSTEATASQIMDGYSSSTFYVADNDKIAFTQSGASQRTELRYEDNWNVNDGITRTLHGNLSIINQTCEQLTFMQIHDDANAGSGPNKPLLRVYKHTTKSPANHIWAAYKTDNGGVNTLHIDLGEAPSGYFDCDVKLESGRMIIDINGSEKANVDVSYWDFPSYWKAGVYLQDAGNATVYYNELTESTTTTPSNGGNLALNKSTQQSTTAHGGLASRAVDGNTSGVWSHGSVTHTAGNTSSPWWEVDLGSNSSIGNINIYNRTNCCMERLSNFTVSVINSAGSTTYSQYFADYPNPSISLNAGGATGRKIRVQINGTGTLSLAEVEVYEFSGTSIQVQAEDYTAMSGIQTENTADTGGGQNVGWINSGDWMEYSVNIPSSGTYTIEYRVASRTNGGNLTTTVNGSTVDNTSFAATGNWQTWTSVSKTVSLSSGNKTFRITSNNDGWNINWFKISSTSSARLANNDSPVVVAQPVQKVSVYPMPFANELNIEVPSADYISYQILDYTGKVHIKNLLSEQGTLKVETGTLLNGVYLLRLQKNDGTTEVIKMIK